MTTHIGNFSLCAAVLTAVGMLLVSFAAVRFDSMKLYRVCTKGLVVLAILLSLASAALLTALVDSDFSISYVTRYTERALPTSYKLAAFWAGQEGSLLLWGWMLGIIGVLTVIQLRNDENPKNASVLATLAVVIGFFAALMLFAANPFELVTTPVEDGRGLNPMLQDPWMISHPPLLFLGYAGYTVPVALLVGALFARRTDNEWLAKARPWVLSSWLFLGAGILLGAKWAYVELGWGGYWAWDPVENASLLPWLTGTALLHCVIAQKQRGMFKRWTAVLTAATFILCIFGTYITRSGVVESVHSFGKSLVGTFFGVFLVLSTLFSIAVIVWRWSWLKPERPMDTLFSREGLFTAANILLCAMCGLTLLGTMWPALSQAMTGQSVGVNQTFYNRSVLPLALLMVVAMALAPVLGYGRQTAAKLFRGFMIPAPAAVVAIVALMVLGITNVWALASAAACTVLIVGVGEDLYRGIRSRAKNTRENLFVAAAKLFDANHRRYGSHVVHAGVALMVIGVAGSSLYHTKHTVQVKPGETVTAGDYHLTFGKLKEERKGNYTSVVGDVSVVDPRGKKHDLLPERRFYDKAENASTEVALRSDLRQDLYVTLIGWEDSGRVTAFQLVVNPLVKWIWIGGLAVAAGAIFCLLPRFTGNKPSQKEQPATDIKSARTQREPEVAVA